MTRPAGAEFLPLSRMLSNTGQTFPPGAVLALAVPILGFGTAPTLVALFLYGLLPIFENALTGLTTIPPDVAESALGAGMNERQRLWQIDLPLALADRIAAAKLPPVLAADILPLAASDWLAHADPYGKDDWTALMSWPGQLTSAQVDGYLLQLVSEGILVPVDEVVP